MPLLNRWKAELTPQEKELFQYIYDYYKKNDEWPNSRTVQLKFREYGNIFEKGQKIGYQFIRAGNPETKDNVSSLSIFGIAICENSETDIELFMSFLKLAVKWVLNNPMNEEISDKDIRESLDVTDSDLLFLRQMLMGSGISRGMSYNKEDSTFTASLNFTDLLRYENCETFEDYIQLNLDYIPKIRFGGNYRRQEISQDSLAFTDEETLLEEPGTDDEIKSKQRKIISMISEHDDYEYSVFISHAYRDYPLLHDLCVDFITKKIRPVLWFKEVKDEIVMNKLCKMIDSSDLFLIHMSKNSVSSQMTNNEIGYIEGKKFYTQKGGDIVLRLFDKNIKPEDFKGFYNKGFDGFDNFDPTSKEDRKEVIRRLNEMSKSLIRLPQYSLKPQFEELKMRINRLRFHRSTRDTDLESALNDLEKRVKVLMEIENPNLYPYNILKEIEGDLGRCINHSGGGFKTFCHNLRDDVIKLIVLQDKLYQ